MMKKTVSCILLTLLVLVSTSIQAQTGPLSQQQARTIAGAVVQILTSGPNGPQQGSGTIVTPTGMIFTNAHVVDGADSIQIRLFDDFGRAPQALYTASVTARVSEGQFDFAVLQISGNLNGSSINTNSLNLTYMSAQSIPINITEDVYFFAYPQIAGGSIAITPGSITTIQTIPVDGQDIFFYQSDAVFGEGASGGLAVNRQGQFIGIPSEMRVNNGGGAQLTTFIAMEAICTMRPRVCNQMEAVVPSDPVISSPNGITGTIDTDRLNTRIAPGPEYEQLDVLLFGTPVTAIGRNLEATWVQTTGGGSVWVNARYVAFRGNIGNLPVTFYEEGEWESAGRPSGVSATANETLRIRGGPGVTYRQLENPDILEPGDAVDIVAISPDGGWYKVNVNGQSGWIRSGYVRLSGGSTANIPVSSR